MRLIVLTALLLAGCATPQQHADRITLTREVFCAMSPEARQRIRDRVTDGVVVFPCEDERGPHN